MIRTGQEGLMAGGPVAPAVPYFLTCLFKEIKRRIVFVQPRSRSLSRLEDRCRFYFSQFSLASGLETLPELAESPYDGVTPSLEAVSSRMSFFYSLGRRSPSLVLAHLFGLLKPFPAPRDLKDSFLELEVGQKPGRDRLLQTLRDFGYAKEELIASAGEYAWRGGVVDVFSPWSTYPHRLEFSGDEVVSIRDFDPSTQRSSGREPRIVVPSLREFPGGAAFLDDWTKRAPEKGAPAVRTKGEKGDARPEVALPPDFAFLALLAKERFVPFTHYLEDSVFIIVDPEEVEKEWTETRTAQEDRFKELGRGNGHRLPPDDIYSPGLWEELRKRAVLLGELLPPEGQRTYHFPFQSVPQFDNKIPFFLQYVKRLQRTRDRCAVFLSNPAVRHRVASLLAQNRVKAREEISAFAPPRAGEMLLLLGDLDRGWSYPPERVTFFSERDVFTEEKVLVSRPARKAFVSHFQDLRENDYVVHTDYGIGIFRGLVRLEVDSQMREFIELSYQDGDRLYVPVEDLNLVQKYSHTGTSLPPLDKLGTGTWQKTKERTKKAIEKMARELLDLYARRKALKGFRFSPSGTWESEFEKTFEYEETEDQLRPSRRSSGTWSRTGRWTGSSAGTWGTARPRWPCGPPSRPPWTGSRWPCSARRPSWPVST
jgi:transcription-repair coupling factor (superfamily II helicase)